MLEHIVRRYYLEEHRDCASTLLRTCRDLLYLKIPEREMCALERLCTSFHRDGICCAYTGALMILHWHVAHLEGEIDLDSISDASTAVFDFFNSFYGSRNCSSIKLSHAGFDVGCLRVLSDATAITREMLRHL